MDWTIKLSYGVLLTSFTGSVLYLAWLATGWVLEKACLIRARLRLLALVASGYFIPAAYLLLRGMGEQRKIGRGYLFAETYDLLLAGKIIAAVWAGGSLLLLMFLVRDGWRLHRKNRDLFCCEAAVCAQFEEIYRSFGGRGERLQIYQSYHFTSPCMCGVLRPKVILPVREYGREELRVILTHEITHYLQGAAVWKWVGLILRTIHFFNPVAWIVCRKMQEWSEYTCDVKACDVLGGKVKQYFQVIADIAVYSSEERLTAQLMEGEHELIKRMEKMKMARKNSKAGFWVKAAAAFLAGSVFLTGSLSVCAAAVKSAEGYEYLYHMTDFGMEEECVPWVDDRKEYVESGDAEGIVVMTGEADVLSHALTAFEWTVGNGELIQTDGFTCEEGNIISICISTFPDTATVKMGIILPDGSKKYILAGGDETSHEFVASLTGEYKVFAENGSKASVKIESHIFSRDRWSSQECSISESGEGIHIFRIYCTGCGYSRVIVLPCDYDQFGYHNTPY